MTCSNELQWTYNRLTRARRECSFVDGSREGDGEEGGEDESGVHGRQISYKGLGLRKEVIVGMG